MQIENGLHNETETNLAELKYIVPVFIEVEEENGNIYRVKGDNNMCNWVGSGWQLHNSGYFCFLLVALFRKTT